MRVLTPSECEFTSGSAFIEGIMTDDFAVGGAVLGLVGVLALGLYAPMAYNKETISLKNALSCTFWTAVQGAKYGLILDVGSKTTSWLYNQFF